MKKIVTALALALLLVFSMGEAAFADVTYTSPGDVEVGTPFRHLLATVSAENAVGAAMDTLPAGCYIETEDTAEGMNIYLSGTADTIGSYSCVIDLGNGSSLICPLNVVAARPAVTSSPDVVCFPNEIIEIFVKASVAGEGSLSYQWYVSSTDSTAGGQPISGAVNPTYLTDTSYIGSNYYYCMVTNTSGSQTRSTVSDTIAVQVAQQQVSAISVNTMPIKVEYMEGDSLDTAGLSIRVDYTDGSSDVITEGFGVYPSLLEKYGDQEIQLSYMNHSCTFNVKVDTEEEIVESIEISSLPHKTRYEVGEDIDIRGLAVKVISNKGEKTVTSGLSCVPSAVSLVGQQTVTVRYMGKACTFTVTVDEPEVPVRIDVASKAKKLEYNVGDTLDTTGLVIRLTGSNGGSEEIRSGFSCEPSVLTTAGRQKITVSYEGFQCTYYVTVAASTAAATPGVSTPAPTLTPSGTPSPAPTIDPDEHKPYDTGISNSVLVVIMIVALVIMLALGVFVFVMQRGGIKNMFRRFRR